MSGIHLALAGDTIDRVDADVAVVTLREDERPLRGDAGRADWRLCGVLSRLVVRGKTSGAWGEAVLVPSTGGLRAPWILALGAGSRADVDEARRRDFARACVERALALCVGGSVALPLPPAGTPDPGVELRLDLLAEALVAAVEGGAAESVEVRILAGPDEWPALAAALEARARASGHPLLHVEPPPRVPHALREPSSRKRRQAAAGDPRPAVK